MDEQARFEASAVLLPKRARLARIALLLPAIALVATVWAGLSGARQDQATANAPVSAAVAAQSPVVDTRPQYPARVLGLDVLRLDEVGPAAVGRGELRAVAGWYVATTITDCPPLAATYRGADAPGSRPLADPWAYCDRFGLLYASRPDLQRRLPTNNLEDNRSKNAGLPVVPVVLAFGIVAPPELEVLGGEATPVVILGRLDDSGVDCSIPTHCGRALVVDHVAWSPGT